MTNVTPTARPASDERESRLPIGVHSDSDIRGGELVFVGTRVPMRAMLDYLEAGDSLNEFLDDYPSVSRDLALGALGQMESVLEVSTHARPSR